MPLSTMQRVVLALTSFKSPLLRTIVPCSLAALALQAAAAAPSIAARSEKFFDVSGSLTFLAVGALSLYLPALRARALAAAADAATTGTGKKLPLLPSVTQLLVRGGGGGGGRNWRQVVLVGLTVVWATRLGYLLFSRVLDHGHDSRFDKIRHRPVRFAAVFFVQAVWVTVLMLPVLALAAVPAATLASASASTSAAAVAAAATTTTTIPRLLVTDVIGLSLWVVGFTFEAVADFQKSRWVRQKKLKQHDEDFMTSGLFSVCRFPNYFGEITLWTGIATAAAGVLARTPVQLALGLTPAATAAAATTSLCFLSPLFTWYIVTRVSGVPLSENKYDERYGHRKDYRAWRDSTPRLVPKLL